MARLEEAPPPDEALFLPGSNILVRAPTMTPPRTTLTRAGAGDKDGSIFITSGGMSDTVEFSTDLWHGKVRVIFKVPPEQLAPDARDLFQGKKRQMWVMVQGRLKRAISCEDLQYGSWFARSLRFPAPFIVGPALRWLAARLGSTLHMQLRGDSPHVTGPLCAAVQTLNISLAGQEPDLAAAPEDTRLLFGPEAMQEPPMPSSKRKAYFRRAANRAGKVFQPGHIITLHCFDHSFDYHTFRMAVPPCFHLDMVKTLEAQPIGIALCDKSTGEWVLRFEVWHRRMLQHLKRHGRRIQRNRERAGRRRAKEEGRGGAVGRRASVGELSGAASTATSGLDAAAAEALAAARESLAAHEIQFSPSSEGDDEDGDEDEGGGGGGSSDDDSSDNGRSGNGSSGDDGWDDVVVEQDGAGFGAELENGDAEGAAAAAEVLKDLQLQEARHRTKQQKRQAQQQP